MPNELRQLWNTLWSNPSFNPPWANRSVSVEIVTDFDNGVLPRSGKVLDIGCGTGEVSKWFATQGYITRGIDIALPVIHQARLRHGENEFLKFFELDVLTQKIPNGPFDILIDRGCFHQIPKELHHAYAYQISTCAAPKSIFLLFIRAYRSPSTIKGDPKETQLHIDLINCVFGKYFKLIDFHVTNLTGAEDSIERNLPGIYFRLMKIN